MFGCPFRFIFLPLEKWTFLTLPKDYSYGKAAILLRFWPGSAVLTLRVVTFGAPCCRRPPSPPHLLLQ